MTDDEISALIEASTPGPWVSACGDIAAQQSSIYVARAILGHSSNARLIAAAPSLAAEVLRLRGALREADLQLAYLDERQPTGTTPAIRARIAAALKGAAQ